MLKKATNFAKKGKIIACLSAIAFSSMFAIKSEATSTYYMRVLFDEGAFGMLTQVIPDKAEGNNVQERADSIDFSAISDYSKVYVGGGQDGTPGSSLIANFVQDPENDTETNEIYEKLKAGGDKNKALVFSFPGITTAVKPPGVEKFTYTALSSDQARAELVGNTLTKGMNDALAFIKTYSGTQHISGEGLRHTVAQLSRITAGFTEGGKDKFNTGKDAGNRVFYLTQVTDANQVVSGLHTGGVTVGDELIPISGLDWSDYVIISTTPKESTKPVYGYFPWRMAKGYHENQPLAEVVGKNYVDNAMKESGKDEGPIENAYMTWGQMAIQAGVNKHLRGETMVDSGSGVTTLLGQGMGMDLTSTIVAVRSMLNLAPIQELILNMGARSANYYYGAITIDIYDTAKMIHAMVFTISMLFLSGIAINTINKKMMSTTNIVAKVSFMEGIQDLMFVGVALVLFPLFFEVMLEINYWIVRTFSFSSEYLGAYGLTSNKVLATESMAGFMVASMFLAIDVYINMTYFARSVVLSFLFAISPLVTVLYPIGPMQKKMYFSFIRELVGNVFMQSFHAITLCFFAGYNSSNLSAMEAIVSAYCFIPITQIFKQYVTGAQGLSESLGGKIAGQLTNTATGMQKSSMMMKQSKELMDQQAKNAKATAQAGFGAQMTSQAFNSGASLLQNGIASMGSSGEIGSRGGGSGSGAKSKGASMLANGAGALAGGSVSMLGAGIGAGKMTATEQKNREDLGKMQIDHSMQNMGAGLAQAGIGMGISSYDSVGGGMASQGMQAVQAGATGYGEGESNSGTGGTNRAYAQGYDTLNTLGARGMSAVAGDALRANRNLKDEQQKNADAQRQQEKTEKARGLDVKLPGEGQKREPMNDTANYIGMKDKNGDDFGKKYDSPVLNVEAYSNNTDNATFTIDAKKETLANANQNDALVNLANQMRRFDGDTTNPTVNQAWKEASAQYGASSTIAPKLTSAGNVEVVLEQVSSRYGLDVGTDGKTYATTSAQQKAHHNPFEPKNKK